MPHLVYILLGSNQGNLAQQLDNACLAIENQIGSIENKSSFYQTAAWGNTQQAAFLNQVISVRTNLAPNETLEKLLGIETQMGRQRIEKWEPRIIDLDILFYDNIILKEAQLIIPHPYIQDRRFTLIPLVEMAPQMVHPLLQLSMEKLLEICPDPLMVEKMGGN